ncbi:extracellular solute-binding protein [Brachybacterium tyrofermentans]|uniref:Extracellular solute-binding protein n=1 Tax=Brachybacterium tyrofermentans TaxID=47848 RepID=A0ABW0FGT9_9MICO
MNISRRHAIGAMAGIPLLASGCSALSGSSSDDRILRINYGGAADSSTIPSPNPIEEALGEKVGFDVVSERSPEDIGAALASGQAPDIFLTSRSRLRQLDAQGLVLDLAPYRDRLADYEKFVGTENVETGMVDDRLIGLVRRPREFSYSALWVRGDWVDQLGLKLPTTTDELIEVLEAFRDEAPGRSDAVPFTGAGASAFTPFFGAFEAGTQDALYAQGGEIVGGYTDPHTAEPMKYIRSLIEAGLVDPDLFSLETAEARDRAFQGSAGAVYLSWDNMTKPEFVEAQKSAQPEADWQMIDLLSAPGKSGGWPTGPFGIVQGIPASVADDEERLDALLTLINYVGTDEGSRLVMFGVEGEHYTRSGDSVEVIPGTEADTAYTFAYQVAGRDESTYLDAKFPDSRFAWEACRERPQVVQYEDLVTPPEGFSTADVETYGSEQQVLFLTGERPLDDYSTFIDELNDQYDYSSFVESAQEQLAELGYPE